MLTLSPSEDVIHFLYNSSFFGRLSSNPQEHEPAVLEAIQKCGMTLKGLFNEKMGRNQKILYLNILDVPGEKIWSELKQILSGRYAGHIMRVILQQQLAPILGAPRCFLYILF